jgi:hypothetical protein
MPPRQIWPGVANTGGIELVGDISDGLISGEIPPMLTSLKSLFQIR